MKKVEKMLLLDPLFELKTLSGEPLKDGEKVVTVRDVLCNVLMAGFEDEKNLPGTKKLERFQLAVKIQKAMLPFPITAEEAALLKDLTAKGYSALVSGQIWELIENLPEEARALNGEAKDARVE